jgi:hypothetical protein
MKDRNEGAVKINEYGFSRNVEIQDYDRWPLQAPSASLKSREREFEMTDYKQHLLGRAGRKIPQEANVEHVKS